MLNELPVWLNQGVEPPESLKTTGWQPGMKPAAQHMNWLFNRSYLVLKELQENGSIKDLQEQVEQLETKVNVHLNEFTSHKNETASQLNKLSTQDGATLIGIKDINNNFTSTNVEDALNEVFTNVSNGKTKIATAITDKGVATSPNDPFITMATNISNIETGKYGTATANDVLIGKTIGTETGLVTGTIPNYGRAVLGQGYTTPKSYLADGGGSLVIEPNTGYYEEGLNAANFGSIILSDGHYKAENILPGKSIFGLAGTASVKKWARGTSGIIPGSVYTQVAFLDFTPSIFLAYSYANDGYYVKYYFSIVSPILLSSGHTLTSSTRAFGSDSVSRNDGGIQIDTSTNIVSVKPAFNGYVTQGLVEWIAIE